ncbi:putative AMID-like mitochondrial oxidoreductase [Talaromyces proteolyticus]|uniref:AMID-like mitochondrial oxidoreductase n=1 Tax=Talaromyces proteolyticus TaxID=1131652 RepID=A0AAD4L156_9EURO|nr:putative AMID-like mitochondrial oxidoreductase [Talaromyces proteolyticus]KAH8701955.1 putative AMID-like mitochondrial oxidoreductase [Talaromyces proteolyticus]
MINTQLSQITDMNRVYLSASVAVIPLAVLWAVQRSRRMEIAKVPSKTVVIIGGSWAGINVAHGLLKQVPNVKVVMINPSEDYYFNVASPRIIARPEVFAREKYMFPLAELFAKYPKGGIEIIIGKATSINTEGKKVSVRENTSEPSRDIAYDYLVIASGSTTKATLGLDSVKVPFKPSVNGSTDAEIKNAQETLKAANSIIIGGAGAVGVELAAEIAQERPNVEVTLITPTDKVLPGLKDGPRNKAGKVLKSLGINLVTGNSVQSAHQDPSSGKWTVTLSNNKTLTADSYVTAAGVVPNNDFIPNTLLNENGWVEVDQYFHASKIQSSASIYAVGDITQNPMRVVSRMTVQAAAVVSNLKADILGKGKRVSFDFDKQGVMMGVPLGRSDGTGQIGSFVIPGFVMAFMKGRDYMTGMGRKMLSG